MNRRQALTTVGLGTAGFVVGTGFTAPACGVSKEKAVRVTGFVIELSKESVPLLELLGARDMAELVSTKALPALEKLKEFLSKAEIPQATNTLETVRNVLKGIGTALLNLPDTPRRTTIVGILASVNVLLLTVEAFVESESGATVARASTKDMRGIRAARVQAPASNRLLKVYEATQ